MVPVPLLGVVKPGAVAAVDAAHGRPIAVLATESTVSSDAYRDAIHGLDPNIPVMQQPCPSLVSVIEEGRDSDDAILRMLLADYLSGVRKLDPAVVLLGCTHYPLVDRAVADLMPDARVVDSAEATARVAHRLLADENALSSSSGRGRLHCYVSDNPARFREVGGRFLGESIRDVSWITPEQFFNENLLHAGTDGLDDAIPV
jgi:glutamate racemase